MAAAQGLCLVLPPRAGPLMAAVASRQLPALPARVPAALPCISFLAPATPLRPAARRQIIIMSASAAKRPFSCKMQLCSTHATEGLWHMQGKLCLRCRCRRPHRGVFSRPPIVAQLLQAELLLAPPLQRLAVGWPCQVLLHAALFGKGHLAQQWSISASRLLGLCTRLPKLIRNAGWSLATKATQVLTQDAHKTWQHQAHPADIAGDHARALDGRCRSNCSPCCCRGMNVLANPRPTW